MMIGTKTVPSAPAELAGDLHPLLEQLGAPDDLAVARLPASLEFRRVSDLPALRRFLSAYRTRILTPVEMPVIVSAYRHATRSETRELLALDARLAGEDALRAFAAASCRVGQRQLSRLRRLRDVRVAQRYLQAIERGEARGWHTLVYGLTLAVYSLPLRQGLQNYAAQTIRGFVTASARTLRLPETQIETLIAEQTGHVPRDIDLALAAQSALEPGSASRALR